MLRNARQIAMIDDVLSRSSSFLQAGKGVAKILAKGGV